MGRRDEGSNHRDGNYWGNINKRKRWERNVNYYFIKNKLLYKQSGDKVGTGIYISLYFLHTEELWTGIDQICVCI